MFYPVPGAGPVLVSGAVMAHLTDPDDFCNARHWHDNRIKHQHETVANNRENGATIASHGCS